MIVLGIGIGLTAATLLFGWLLIRANRIASDSGKEITKLLWRRTEAVEMIAGQLERLADELRAPK
jgi:hypothetical protein